MSKIKLIECPRDAMQGYSKFIKTEKKINYINNLLKVGFYAIDCGSFVSEKMIPQMYDTPNVIKSLIKEESKTKIIVIVANERGALDASNYDQINIFGYPFSVSENFQMRNTNKTIKESINVLNNIIEISDKSNKEVVVYLSMAFGNPYGEKYHPEIVAELTEKLHQLDVKIIALSDTIGVSNRANIAPLFSTLISEYSEIEFGAHFHSTAEKWKEKVDSAYQNGCRRFDSAIKGLGGCPMAKDDLTGNMPTEKIISYFSDQLEINKEEFDKSLKLSETIF